MLRLTLALALLVALPLWPADGAAGLARQVRDLALDPDECYRVRDISFSRQEIRFFFNDGYLIFAKPIEGVRTAAVFAADSDGGDAEVLVFPPHSGERLSLASFTGSPNLNDHFKSAVMVFSDDAYPDLMARIRAGGEPKKSAEIGMLLAQGSGGVARNLATSFVIRLVADLLSEHRPANGFFYAAVSGKRLNNFDLVHDPRSREQITIGQVNVRQDRIYFDFWTSFESRAARQGARAPNGEDLRLGNFRIQATLEPSLRLRATTRVTVTPGPRADRALFFDVSRRIRVSKVRIDGQPVEFLQRESLRANLIRGADNDQFLVIPAAPLEPGRGYEIEFEHEGDVISDAGNHVYFVGARGNWYPNRDMQFADYEITFRYPKSLSLVATGEVVADSSEGEWRTTRRKTTTPVRFAGFNLGEYEKAAVSKGGYTVEVYANRHVETALQPKAPQVVVLSPFPPRRGQITDNMMSLPADPAPSPKARLQTLATDIAAAFEFMAARFGPPPLSTVTVSPIPGTFGQGFPGLIYLSTLSYLPPKERVPGSVPDPNRLLYSELLHAHEIAHQWWGNTVTATGYRDEWLMESLADYSALVFLEKRRGVKMFESVLEQYMSHLLETNPDGKTLESMGPIIWGTRLRSSLAPDAWRIITYQKGAWIIHMLRRRLGDERFFAMLAELCRRYRFQGFTTEQFRLLAKDYLPPQSIDPTLEEFFERWVYGTGIPTLKMSYTTRGKTPALKLSVTVTQSGLNDEATVQVPVEIQFARAKPLIRWVRTGADPVTFEIPVKQAPSKLLLAPGLSVLALRK